MTTDYESFRALVPQMAKIDERDIRRSHIPLDVALHEAGIMLTAAREDAAYFAAAGFDTARIDELAAATAALRYAHGEVVARLGLERRAVRRWNEEMPRGRALRAELLAVESFALRNLPDASGALRKIREHRRNSDLMLDLHALAQIGREGRAFLEAVNFDCSLLDLADRKADMLGRIFAAAFLGSEKSGYGRQRDRVFTYMCRVMADIRSSAKYVFRNHRERIVYYQSAYRRRCRMLKSASEVTVPEIPPASESAGIGAGAATDAS